MLFFFVLATLGLDCLLCKAPSAAAVAPMPNIVAFRCSSELFLCVLFRFTPVTVPLFPNARSELAEDEESLAKLNNPCDFLDVFRSLLRLSTAPSLAFLSSPEEPDRDAAADDGRL